MCLSKSSPAPAAPTPVAPPPTPQVEKAPERQPAVSNSGKPKIGTVSGGRISGGTLLTGPTGIDNSMLSTGKTMLGQ